MEQSALLALARRFFRAIEDGDTRAIVECWTPDIRVWHSFDTVELGAADAMAALGWFFSALPDRRYEVASLDAFEGGFVQRHTLVGRLANGQRLEWPACAVCRVNEGRIARLDEYMDSRQLSLFPSMTDRVSSPG